MGRIRSSAYVLQFPQEELGSGYFLNSRYAKKTPTLRELEEEEELEKIIDIWEMLKRRIKSGA